MGSLSDYIQTARQRIDQVLKRAYMDKTACSQENKEKYIENYRSVCSLARTSAPTTFLQTQLNSNDVGGWCLNIVLDMHSMEVVFRLVESKTCLQGIPILRQEG